MMLMAFQHDVASSEERAFVDMLLTSFDQRWEKYRRELRRCQRKCSEKAVHDLRVATRRLVSSIDIISIAVDDDRLDKLRQMLRKRFKESGPLRDVQIQLLRLEKVRDKYPELEQFYTLLLLREQRLLKSLDREIRRVRVGTIEQQVREVRTRLPQQLEGRGAVARTAATGAAAAAFLKAVVLLTKVDPMDPRTVHRLRISFKKFRYIVESLQHVLPGITHALLKAMNQYQVRMGVIQDYEVLSASFRGYLSKVRKGSRINFLPFQQELVREKQGLLKSFLESAGDLHAFWTMQNPAGIRKPKPNMNKPGVV